jgi:hypothetical protein
MIRFHHLFVPLLLLKTCSGFATPIAPRSQLQAAGEWAGWESTFAASGKCQKVSEDYLPKDLLEWGVDLWGFETLTSETIGAEEIYRKRARVFPEVGCGVDNLAVEVMQSRLPLGAPGSQFIQSEDGGYVLSKNLDRGKTEVEFCVVHHPEEDLGTVRSRIRLRGEFGVTKALLSSPITITRERLYDEFNDGKLYKGGGLDASTLAKMIRAKCLGDANGPFRSRSHWRTDSNKSRQWEATGTVLSNLEQGGEPSPLRFCAKSSFFSTSDSEKLLTIGMGEDYLITCGKLSDLFPEQIFVDSGGAAVAAAGDANALELSWQHPDEDQCIFKSCVAIFNQEGALTGAMHFQGRAKI